MGLSKIEQQFEWQIKEKLKFQEIIFVCHQWQAMGGSDKLSIELFVDKAI